MEKSRPVSYTHLDVYKRQTYYSMPALDTDDVVILLEQSGVAENTVEMCIRDSCGRGSTDTFLPLRLFLQDQSKYKVWQEEQTLSLIHI